MIALQSIKLESYLPILFCTIALQSIKNHAKIYKGGNSNLIDAMLGVTSLFYFARLHSNVLNWSYLPCTFCVIALQSIKLELPPLYILRDCIAIY